MDPSIPDYPSASESAMNLWSLKYYGSNTLTIGIANITMETLHVLSNIRRYSSHKSVVVSQESILNAPVQI